MPTRYAADSLINFATTLLVKTGIPPDRASMVASTLVESDLMGHTTHGLQLLKAYLDDASAGKMKHEGVPQVVNDRGAAITWNADYLPGPWVVHQAMDLAFKRIEQHPVVSVAIQRSHHIGCLAAYPERATKKGLVMLLASSDPRNKTVAPYGAIRPVYSPDPLAVGIPTETDPIIFDISMSTTTNGMVNRLRGEGKKLPHAWLIDKEGNPTDVPDGLAEDPPSSIMPVGGMDLGYKGFALGILIEMLTSALAGCGRADGLTNWTASVFLQVINPDAFGGLKAFTRETEFLKQACEGAMTRDGDPRVRMPGSRALNLRNEQRKSGVILYPSIVPALQECAEKYGVKMPETLSS